MDEPRVLFLADKFADAARDDLHSHPGGAELTDAAALASCPWPVETARAGHFHPRHLADFDLHVVANTADAPDDLLDALANRGRHVLFEHDVRICDWRGNFPAASDPVHRRRQRCTCRHPRWQRVYASSLGTVFLTHRQAQVFLENPFFTPPRTAVLGSSLMDDAFLDRARQALDADEETTRDIEAAILDSGQRIKGTEPAREFCRARGVEPFEIGGLSPDEVLDVLERTQTFVYLPLALEPAGRMLVESRFLGCSVVANGYTGVVGESWWNLEDDDALEILADAPDRFWRIVDRFRRIDADENRDEGRSATDDRAGDRHHGAERLETELARALSATGGLVASAAPDRVQALRRPRVVTDDPAALFD